MRAASPQEPADSGRFEIVVDFDAGAEPVIEVLPPPRELLPVAPQETPTPVEVQDPPPDLDPVDVAALPPGGGGDGQPAALGDRAVIAVASPLGRTHSVRFGVPNGRRDGRGTGRGTGTGTGEGSGSGSGVAACLPPVACAAPAAEPPPSGPARLVESATPAYPESARQRGDEGVVLLQAEILADGTVGEVTVLRSSGSAALDRAAVASVREWKFAAALDAGTPVRSTLRLPAIRFRLD